MVKVEMYRSFDGKIFEKREDCMVYEETNKEMQYEKLKELKQVLDDYCSMVDDCYDCIFKNSCGNVYSAITEEMINFEGE